MATHRYMENYNDTFAPVAKMDSIRLALAIAASKQWEVHHMDVKCDFLNGDLTKRFTCSSFKALLLIHLLCAG